MFTHVCVYIYIYICIHIHAHTCVTCVNVYVHMHYACVCGHTFTCWCSDILDCMLLTVCMLRSLVLHVECCLAGAWYVLETASTCYILTTISYMFKYARWETCKQSWRKQQSKFKKRGCNTSCSPVLNVNNSKHCIYTWTLSNTSHRHVHIYIYIYSHIICNVLCYVMYIMSCYISNLVCLLHCIYLLSLCDFMIMILYHLLV